MSELMRETEIYEQFLTSLTLAISNYIIVVLNETTLPDQRFLHTIAKAWKHSHSQNKFPEVFVIHNFRYTTTIAERDDLFKKSTEQLLDGQIDDRISEVPLFTSSRLRTRHVCLMNDDTRFGHEYNNKIFDHLKQWIRTMLPVPPKAATANLEANLAAEFAKACTSLLHSRGFLENVERIALNTDDNSQWKFVAEKKEKEKSIAISSSNDDKYYGLLESGTQPTHSVVEYVSKTGKVCRLVRLQVPGVKEVKVNKQDQGASILNHWAIDITGTKEKSDYGISEIRHLEEVTKDDNICPKDDNICPKDENTSVSKEPLVDHCKYGEFHERFHIPQGFRRKVTRVGPREGIFYAIFQPEDDAFDT